ncbi:hypothetical protein PIB30_068522 [Stylosanthes scabra]|uniref:Uncharacterized protein n=1 Tax=Stylosanthes scabra TaxID=79078 RepID=A0ABU6TNN6_9FABA|nr:hypothetical protein [Stylosanthes scabra]
MVYKEINRAPLENQPQVEVVTEVAQDPGRDKGVIDKNNTYGPWMVVERQKRTKRQNFQDGKNVAGGGNTNSREGQKDVAGSKSRYEVMGTTKTNDEVGKERQENEKAQINRSSSAIESSKTFLSGREMRKARAQNVSKEKQTGTSHNQPTQLNSTNGPIKSGNHFGPAPRLGRAFDLEKAHSSSMQEDPCPFIPSPTPANETSRDYEDMVVANTPFGPEHNPRPPDPTEGRPNGENLNFLETKLDEIMAEDTEAIMIWEDRQTPNGVDVEMA